MGKKCEVCGSSAREFVLCDEPLTKDGKHRSEVCLFCYRNVLSLGELSPMSKEIWKAAAAAANYIESRLAGVSSSTG